MEISVIIPSYKPQEYIWECLDSIINQTLNKSLFEVIIIINGCNEPYYSEVKAYFNNNRSDIKIRVIQTDQGGVSNARNIGIEMANGKYIAFIDDDDYLSPSYLEEMYHIAKEGFLPLCNLIAFSDKTKLKEENYIANAFIRNFGKRITHIMQVRSYFSICCCKLIDKNTIGNRRFNTKIRIGEDSLFMFLISDKINKIKLTSKEAIYFRRNRCGSAINSNHTFAKKMKRAIYISTQCIHIYITNPLNYNFLFFASRIFAVMRSLIKKK